MTDTATFDSHIVRDQILAVFDSWGMPRSLAETSAASMVETDLRGIDSHGLGMLPSYDERRQRGIINMEPDIAIVREKLAVALIDADRCLGHPPAVRAMDLAMEKARQTGAAAVAVRNSNHFGAAGVYSLRAARAGMIGMAMTNAPTPAMVPTFGRDPVLGTNPIAFAAPASQNAPFALDMATTTVAFGKLTIAKRKGIDIPEGWASDSNGVLTRDSAEAHASRRLSPLGGTRELGSHKGYGLAAMVEVLCSILAGSWSDPGSGEGASRTTFNVGHFFLAIDPDRFRGDSGFQDDLDRLVDMLRDTPAADADHSVMVAGDPEHAAYEERQRNGIPITPALQEEVRLVCEACGAPFMLGGAK